MRCTKQQSSRQMRAKLFITSSLWKRELRSRSSTIQVSNGKRKCETYIYQPDEFHLLVFFKLLNLLSRRNHVDIQTAVRIKVYVIWRNRKYEKFSKTCELFENHNFRRTPRNNSSQNSLSGNLVKLNRNYESDAKSIDVNKPHKYLWVLCFCGLKSSKFQLFLEQKINFFGQELACLAQVKLKLLSWTELRGVL